jgi:hypothetical protein
MYVATATWMPSESNSATCCAGMSATAADAGAPNAMSAPAHKIRTRKTVRDKNEVVIANALRRANCAVPCE